MTREQFILEIGPAAQRQMQKHNILASLILAQACLESCFGQSGLAKDGKNLFGIKGKGSAGSITMTTKEYVNGKEITVNAAFAKYTSWDDSIEAHCQLFLNGVSWDRNKYKSIIGEKDYKKACLKVQQAGYATDPNYAGKLIKLIEQNKFFAWDKVAIKVPKIDRLCKIEYDGIKYEGVVINGVSYAPVREVFEAAGFNVGWNEKTSTVELEFK